ncbi:MAG: DinB family protein [Dehalococcoidia bacterium]
MAAAEYRFETRRVQCPNCGEADEPLDVMGALTAAPELITAALHDSRSTANDGWTPQEVAAHLADTEVFRGMRFRRIIAEDNPAIERIDGEVWAAALYYSQRDVATSFATFAANRRANLEMLRLAGEAALDRLYLHESLGPLTLRSLVDHTTHHDLAHLRQISAG